MAKETLEIQTYDGRNFLLMGGTVRACYGSQRHPCGAIEVHRVDGTKQLLGPSEYNPEQIKVGEYSLSHTSLSKGCLQNYLAESGLPEEDVKEIMEEYNLLYSTCPGHDSE
ncbi:hypothetical protein HN832_03780 [archaeon]|jgi:hypothetical protein|nr:hypothetical protein [archaeon]MBT4373485.1 hypothetical protein [archaeon]MBT4531933.1 hypothetical protein [archaeon]MBT7001600.1 hypothetical protein [archaeon]MBT7282508.1 hypothetical protein [archaeon]